MITICKRISKKGTGYGMRGLALELAATRFGGKSKCPVMLKKGQGSAQTQFPPPDFWEISAVFSGFRDRTFVRFKFTFSCPNTDIKTMRPGENKQKTHRMSNHQTHDVSSFCCMLSGFQVCVSQDSYPRWIASLH